MKVFISYAREDYEAARKISNDLKTKNIETWLDQENLLPGQNWKMIIAQEINNCSHFLALLSSNSVTKRGFVQKELNTALEVLDEYPKSKIFLMPVRLDECRAIDKRLQDLHRVDLFPDYESGMEKLIKGILHNHSDHSSTVSQDSLNSRVQIILDGELAQFNELKKARLLDALSRILQIEEKQIKILRVAEGSVSVEIEMPTDSAEQLISLFKDNDKELIPLIEKFYIKEIKILKKNKRIELVRTDKITNSSSAFEMDRSNGNKRIKLPTVSRIAKIWVASSITQILVPACSFILVYFIARLLGVSGLGVFTSAMSLLIIFQAFASSGFQYLITREIAMDSSKASKFFVNASFIGLIFSIPIAGLMCIVIHYITDDPHVIQAVYVLSISLIPYTLGVVFQSISRGFGEIEHIAIATVIGNVFQLLLGIFVLFRYYNITYLMFVIFGSHLIVFIISLSLTLKCISRTRQKFSGINFVFCRWILRNIPVSALSLIVGAISMHINIVILTNMMGAREVGLYSAAARLVNLFNICISFYIMALQPVIFTLFKSSFEKFEILCTKSIRYLSILMLPIIAVMTITGDRFILIIFKDEFLPSTAVLNILIWVLLLRGFSEIFAYALMASNRQNINLKAKIIGMLSNVCLCILLIPTLSIIGVAIANVAAAFITFVHLNYFVSKNLLKINMFHLTQKPIISSALMIIVLFLLKDINFFLLIFLSFATYFLCLLALKTITVKEINLFKESYEAAGDSRHEIRDMGKGSNHSFSLEL